MNDSNLKKEIRSLLHDMKQPLFTIVGHSELMLLTDELNHDSLGQTVDCVQTITDLIDKLEALIQ